MGEEGAWQRALELCKSLRESILAGNGPFTGTADWNVTKASIETMVRWGVYPALSSGVGIHLKKRSSMNKDVQGASSAILDYSKEEAPAAAEDHPATPLVETIGFLRDVAVDLSPNASSLRELVISHHLPDLWAGCLELAFGPSFKDEKASEILDFLIRKLPVKPAVEAIFILLRQENCPGWFKLEAGKILSKIVMQDGGVSAVLEVLIGNASQGNVPAQRKVASQIAKAPKYVATPEEYYRNVCPQVLELLSLRSNEKMRESAATVVGNIRDTAIIVACMVAIKEPRYTEEFMVKPLVAKVVDQREITRDLYEAMFQIHALVTAGHDGNAVLKKLIFEDAKGISEKLDQVLAEQHQPFFQDSDFEEAEFRAVVDDVLMALVVQPAED